MELRKDDKLQVNIIHTQRIEQTRYTTCQILNSDSTNNMLKIESNYKYIVCSVKNFHLIQKFI